MIKPHPFESNSLKRVIVVEDDPSLRMSMVSYLAHDGYTVTGIDSAYEFYQQVYKEPYTVGIIDIALADQNGIVLVEYARKNTAMRIITLSERFSTTTLATNIKAAGADLNLTKPVNCRLLVAYVNTLFSRLGS
ncbi:MAG: response regulator [Chlorobiaceae bacterium]